MSIRSFSCRDTETFFNTGNVGKKSGWKSIAKIVARKLDMLEYAEELNDLKVPPGNRLEALKGDRKGQFGIRINDQWRIVFRWTPVGPKDVEIIDYHS